MKASDHRYGRYGALLALATLACAACSPATKQAGQLPAASEAPSKWANVDRKRLEAVDATRSDDGNWLSHGRTYSEQRFSPLTQINDGNVGQLGLAWSYKIDYDQGIEATPVVVDGVMYTTGGFNVIYALNAATGELIWKHDPNLAKDTIQETCCGGINRGVAVWDGKVYSGILDGRLIAVDAKTGALVWSVDTRLDGNTNYTISGAPRVARGKVLIGNGGAEYGVRGYVTAYDAGTGKQAWRFFTVPGDPSLPPENEAMAMAMKTWDGDRYVEFGGGGTVWDSIVFDPEFDRVYIGTGNGSPWNYQVRSNGKGDNLFLSSIVALDIETGQYVWHYQTNPGEFCDYTATQPIMLADLKIDGRDRKVLMQAPKNGFFYVIDRTNGKLISAEPIMPMNWATGVDLETGRPKLNMEAIAYWLDGKARVVWPGNFGAHNWHPWSYNPQSGLVYIPAQESAAAYDPVDRPMKRASGKWNLGMAAWTLPDTKEEMDAAIKGVKGQLIAWDPVRQRKAWSHDYPTIYNGGTLATAGNLVFQGTADGRVMAFSADKGEVLWESPANTGVMAGPVSYMVDGVQYVTFMVGWGGPFPLITGAIANKVESVADARVLTFAIGGKQTLPPKKPLPAPLNKTMPPDAPAASVDGAALARGRVLFNENCAACHGIDAISGGTIPDLRYLSSENHRMFPGIVMGARRLNGMPSFVERLNMDEVSLIHEYLLSRRTQLVDELKSGQ